MDLVVDQVSGSVVLNVANVCGVENNDCRACYDVGGLVHNWLMQHELQYVIIDLQDEKDICRNFIVELLQLRKRLRIPFLFAGVMKRPHEVLEQYDFINQGTPVFVTPEDAVAFLQEKFAPLVKNDLSAVKFGEPVLSLKARQLLRAQEAQEEAMESDL